LFDLYFYFNCFNVYYVSRNAYFLIAIGGSDIFIDDNDVCVLYGGGSSLCYCEEVRVSLHRGSVCETFVVAYLQYAHTSATNIVAKLCSHSECPTYQRLQLSTCIDASHLQIMHSPIKRKTE